jgi:hypothetical protein
VIPINARALRITAAAGTELAGASSGGTVRHGTYWVPCGSSLLTEVYDPKAFFPHTASLRQGFPHCAIFPTAASRRSLGRVSVPVWLIILSDQLPIVALVGRYPANKLMGRGLIWKRQLASRGRLSPQSKLGAYTVLAAVSRRYPEFPGRLSTRYSPVRRSTQLPKEPFSHDLHVLSTPPAFNLSQDQTLQFKSFQLSL